MNGKNISDSLEKLARLVESRNCRLEELRKAALPLAELLAKAHRPKKTKYILRYEYKCGRKRLVVWNGERNECWEPVEWTLEREVGELKFVCVDGQIPRGPSRQELLEFCRWLADPQTWEDYYKAEKAISDEEAELVRRLAEGGRKEGGD